MLRTTGGEIIKMDFAKGLFMWILVIGLIIGLGYGVLEVWDLIKDFVVHGWNWDIIRENFRGISLASIELAVIGQSYIIAKQAKVG